MDLIAQLLSPGDIITKVDAMSVKIATECFGTTEAVEGTAQEEAVVTEEGSENIVFVSSKKVGLYHGRTFLNRGMLSSPSMVEQPTLKNNLIGLRLCRNTKEVGSRAKRE